MNLDGAPNLHGDWPALLATARKLLADRVEGDPAQLEAGRLTEDQVDLRQRVARSIVAMWTAMIDRADAPECEALEFDIRTDLTAVAQAAAGRAARDPDAIVMRDEGGSPVTRTLFAHRLAALAWWHDRWERGFGSPRILIHLDADANLRRARNTAGRAAA